MQGRTAFEASHDKRMNIERCEAEGRIADSMDVRTALIKRLHAGELTLAEVQAELAAIKRGAKKAGTITRTQAYRQG